MSDLSDTPPDFDGLVERFDHVALAVWDLASHHSLMTVLGARFRKGGTSRGGFHWAQFDLPGSGKVELLQPVDPDDGDHFLVRFLHRHGEGMHHLTFKVGDLDEAVAAITGAGYEIVGLRTRDERWREAFIHPRSAHGVLIQLAQWTDDVDRPRGSFDDVLDQR
jgi:methylmalonyl-CoA epimerase